MFLQDPILLKLPEVLPPDQAIFLVGGAVRDELLEKSSRDLDFVVESGAIGVARSVADAFQGYFYPLDLERDYGRVILEPGGDNRLILDFTPFQGPDLETDLRARDFTINAMAVDVRQPNRLIDPLGGLQDLRARVLRACSAGAFAADPVRVLRAVRLATGMKFKISKETRQQLHAAAPLLTRSSMERIRDEIFRILGGPRPGVAIRTLDRLGALSHVLPELEATKDVTQSPPHIYEVWEHSLKTLDYLESLLSVLHPDRDPDSNSNLRLGLASIQLGRFRERIREHLSTQLTPERNVRGLLFLAALYHDVGKPSTRRLDADGRIRFFEHEKVGAQMASRRGNKLQLSNAEVARLKTIVYNHMRPHWLTQSDQTPGRRAVYRFFRSTGIAGVDICLLSIADTAATYGPELPTERWSQILEFVRILLQTWWEGPGEVIHPEALVNGKDLIDRLRLEPGPEIGRLLEAIREAQVTGQVRSRPEALEYAALLMEEGPTQRREDAKDDNLFR